MTNTNLEMMSSASTLHNKVSVTTSARLHMGFFDLNGGLGRRFGSIGVALQTPTISLTAFPEQTFSAEGVGANRAVQIAEQLAQRWIDSQNRFDLVLGITKDGRADYGHLPEQTADIEYVLKPAGYDVGDVCGHGIHDGDCDDDGFPSFEVLADALVWAISEGWATNEDGDPWKG